MLTQYPANSTSRSGLVLDALLFAIEKHKGQTRRHTQLPYITHPIAVSYIVAQFKRSKRLPELVAAAILHDVLEDTDTTYADVEKRFGPLVASLVQELTSDPIEIAAIGKLAYFQKKLPSLSNYALTIKLADRLHNVSDRPTVKMLRDTLDLLPCLQSRRLTGPQQSLVQQITAICKERLRVIGNVKCIVGVEEDVQ